MMMIRCIGANTSFVRRLGTLQRVARAACRQLSSSHSRTPPACIDAQSWVARTRTQHVIVDRRWNHGNGPTYVDYRAPNRWTRGYMKNFVEDYDAVHKTFFGSELENDKKVVPEPIRNASANAGNLGHLMDIPRPAFLAHINKHLSDFEWFVRALREVKNEARELEDSAKYLTVAVLKKICELDKNMPPMEPVFRRLHLKLAQKVEDEDRDARPDIVISSSMSLLTSVVVEVKRDLGCDSGSAHDKAVAQGVAYCFAALQENFKKLPKQRTLDMHLAVQLGSIYEFYKMRVTRTWLKEYIEAGLVPAEDNKVQLLRYDASGSTQLDIVNEKSRMIILTVLTKYLKQKYPLKKDVVRMNGTADAATVEGSGQLSNRR